MGGFLIIFGWWVSLMGSTVMAPLSPGKPIDVVGLIVALVGLGIILGGVTLEHVDVRKITESKVWKKDIARGTYSLSFSTVAGFQVYLGIEVISKTSDQLVLDLYQIPREAFSSYAENGKKLVVAGTDQFKRFSVE